MKLTTHFHLVSTYLLCLHGLGRGKCNIYLFTLRLGLADCSYLCLVKDVKPWKWKSKRLLTINQNTRRYSTEDEFEIFTNVRTWSSIHFCEVKLNPFWRIESQYMYLVSIPSYTTQLYFKYNTYHCLSTTWICHLKNRQSLCETWSSRGRVYDIYIPLGSDVMYFYRNIRTFWKNLLSPSEG